VIDRDGIKEAETAAENALAAVSDFIVSTLKNEADDSRFSDARRLCEIAQALVKASARRAEDFADPDAAVSDLVLTQPPLYVAANAIANRHLDVNYVNAMRNHVNTMMNTITVNTGNIFTAATTANTTITFPVGQVITI